ncbi:MAG: TIGR04282 family arsenosugar biosynthesis glycosyltransferase [Gammaproteobacteria bacterium]|nr:TIGR04282 family arsenosugar biosynthesis glycosyltransferase [Gammaproteobacteria bacterium]
MKKNTNKLLIFTRSPVLGEVKTRLQPEFTLQQSLELHKKMMLNTLALSEKLDDLDIELCCAPNRNTLFFLECENQFPVSLSNQQGDELGERMAFSLSVALQTYDKVIIIGTDCPAMDTHYIGQAVNALDKVDAVIGPAADGGYVLLGLRRFSPALFAGFNWGSDTVLVQTREVLKKLNWSFEELAIMHDIDRPEDLYRNKELLNAIT